MLPRLMQARRLLFLRLLLRYLSYGTALLLLGAALLTAAERLTAEAALGDWRPWLLTAAGVIAAACLLAAWRGAPDLKATARLAERRFGLDERLSTSLEVSGHNPLAAALRHDAEASARLIQPRELVALRPTGRQAAALLGSLTLLLLGLFLPLAAAPQATPTSATGGAPAPGGAPSGPLPVEFLRQLPAGSSHEVRAAGGAEPGARQQPARAAPPAPGVRSGGDQRAAAQDASAPSAASGQPQLLDRQGGGDAALPGAPRAAAAGEPPPDAAAPSARNDGSTNPSFGQASSRDQELREYAKRREATAGPGGGGDPVALADASVAGDATAGYGQDGAAPPPLAANAPADELDVGVITDSSGRRVTVERLPDEPGAVSAGGPPMTAWVARTEAPVARQALSATDIELLRRYNLGDGR